MKSRQRRSTARMLATWGAGLFLLLQVAGLQQLCACGGCAVSHALGIGNSDEHFAGDGHPCCGEREEASAGPRWHATDEPCGCDDAHVRAATDMFLRPLPELPDGPTWHPTTSVSVMALADLARADEPARTHLARGPPGVDSGPPIYVRQLVLRL